MTVRKPKSQLPFKAKKKPGIGANKKRRKSDMMRVTREQDRKFAAKLLRPLVAGDFFQPRLAAADKRLQQNTLPPLEKSRWIPENKETGTPGHLWIDPRRKESIITLRKLVKTLRIQDNYLNPEMRAYPKQKKKHIQYVDITNDNMEETIPHTDSSTSEDEFKKCTHQCPKIWGQIRR